MTQLLKIIGCGVVYFLVVYVFIIRRDARPIVPWAVCIFTQSFSTVFFYDVVGIFKKFLPEEQFGSLGMVIPSAILCFGNSLLIVLMFGKYMNKKEKEKRFTEDENDFRITPLPTVNEQVQEQNSNTDPDITMAFIEKMIGEGRRDEALKYLKMLAYYGKDDFARSEASKKLAELTAAGE